MDLNNMLKIGANIDISLKNKDGSPHHLKTRVESAYDNGEFEILSPMENGVNFMLPTDTEFPIIFEDNSHKTPKVYKMNVALLSKRNQKNNLIIKLKKTSSPTKIERRQTYRLQITKTFSCKYEDTEYDLLLKDMSITGIRAIINKRIPSAQIIDVFMNLGTQNSPNLLSVKAEIISCDKLSDSIRQHDLRLKFINMTPKKIDKLSKYIVSEQSKILHNIHETKFDAQPLPISHDQRHRDDNLIKAIPIFGLISWIMSLVTIVFFLQARPEQLYNLDQFFHFQKRRFWDQSSLNAAILSAQIEFIFCIIGLVLNSKRHKRKEDRYHKGIILNLILSSAILVIALMIL